jgi:hypothetical protein
MARRNWAAPLGCSIHRQCACLLGSVCRSFQLDRRYRRHDNKFIN